MSFCTKCGTEVPENVNFCTKCGNTTQESKGVNPFEQKVSREAYQEAYLGISAWDYYVKCIKNYANFKGRARRKEYWKFFLINFIISFGLSFLYGFFAALLPDKTSLYGFFMVLSWLYTIFMLSPYLAVLIRRLHDTGRIGWWWLMFLPSTSSALIPTMSINNIDDLSIIKLLPIVGAIILSVWCCEDSEPGENAYGPNPKG